jgi:hypothetical protein
MPANKDFKRLVRARMRKTSEIHTAARAQLLTKTLACTSLRAPTAAGYPKLAGIGDAAVKAKTGCGW